MAARHKAGKPKGREAIRAFHRQAIIEATIDSIVEHGFAATSISKIVERAGLSRAMVNIYFQSKEQLLVEVLRYKADQYNDYWKRAIARRGPSPEERLKALVEADFHPKILNRRNMAFWFAFRGEARSKPEYIPSCTTRDHTLREAFASVFSQLIPAEQAKDLSAEEMASGFMLLTRLIHHSPLRRLFCM